MNDKDLQVYNLGKPEINSPLQIPQFIDNESRVLVDVDYARTKEALCSGGQTVSFENAGPRKKIFFDPKSTKAAIVTCGGLCPGLNNVIRTIVNELYYQYEVKTIYGVLYGYEGLIASYGHKFLELNPDVVDDIYEKGGTILGSSRGRQDVPQMVDTLVKNNISILFTIGGDGTFHGALEIFEEINKRNLKIAVVGVPKTIDNDIQYADRTFGFSTAVSVATTILQGAHMEAKGAKNGIGLVKVMGRDSGFIAGHTALASNEVNYVFIPEIKFKLYGNNGFLEHLKARLIRKSHALILVSEGAGQEYFAGEKDHDASGNLKYGDIGLFLKDEIIKYFKNINFEINLKYIDPSYIIRSVPASADDAVFCIMLAQNAVHGAMAGKSGIYVGRWNNYFTFIPLKLGVETRKRIEPTGYLWSMIKGATGQPDFV